MYRILLNLWNVSHQVLSLFVLPQFGTGVYSSGANIDIHVSSALTLMALLTDGAFTLVHLAIWSLVTIIKSVTMTGARSSFRQTVTVYTCTKLRKMLENQHMIRPQSIFYNLKPWQCQKSRNILNVGGFRFETSGPTLQSDPSSIWSFSKGNDSSRKCG
jgi:hypothetical protein